MSEDQVTGAPDTSDVGPPDGIDFSDLARDATPRSELWLYFFAATSYIVCGFLLKQIFAWWWFGAIWFVGFVWLVPNVQAWWRSRRIVAAEPV